MPDVSITNAVFASAVVFRFHRISDMDISEYSPFFRFPRPPGAREITVRCLGYTGVY